MAFHAAQVASYTIFPSIQPIRLKQRQPLAMKSNVSNSKQSNQIRGDATPVKPDSAKKGAGSQFLYNMGKN